MGVLGADSVGGARFERMRIGALTGGSVLRSMADAERGGAVEGEGWDLGPVIPGDAVCALAGGGGGGAEALELSSTETYETCKLVNTKNQGKNSLHSC